MVEKRNSSLNNRAIHVDSYSIIFYFNEHRNGYDLEFYRPSLTEMNFRMRDLIFFFRLLDNEVEGFKALKER